MDMSGIPMQVTTTGNDTAHIILRGEQQSPNHTPEHIASAAEMLRSKGLPEAIMVDASHGNSAKDFNRQIEVIREISRQISLGQRAIIGAMIESNLVSGNQPLVARDKLVYGQSITDACVDLETTDEMFQLLAAAAKSRRNR
jgi:3-deoxy-7-phosphoheptulonate synthase